MMREQNAAFALEANYKEFDDRFPEAEWILINPPVGPNGKSSVGAYTNGYRTYAVSRRAQELAKLPVIAKLLEWMSTDGYNTVVYGEEAENYMIDDDGNITLEGLPDPNMAYTKKAAAPVIQLRNLVFYNSNLELENRYPTWYSQNGKEMSAYTLLREMQKCPWTMTINIPSASPELREFFQSGIRDFITGRLDLNSWSQWLKEFDARGGSDWERRCILFAEENDLLMEKTIVVDENEI